MSKNNDRNKQLMIDQLRKTPIIEVCCEKINIHRATFYRWRKDDKEFAKQADIALGEGSELINDMAESQLISAIRDRNLSAIIFWLRNHHQLYTDKLKISGNLTTHLDTLSPEQEASIRNALELASLAIKKGGENVSGKS